MGRSLVFSPRAAADIDRIYDFTEARWGPEQAETYTFELRAICRRLCETPRPGRSAGDVRKGYFVCPIGSHNIFFREEKLKIVIVRILHNRMDLSRHL